MFGYGTCFNCGESLMGYGYPCVQCGWGDYFECYGTDTITEVRVDAREVIKDGNS